MNSKKGERSNAEKRGEEGEKRESAVKEDFPHCFGLEGPFIPSYRGRGESSPGPLPLHRPSLYRHCTVITPPLHCHHTVIAVSAWRFCGVTSVRNPCGGINSLTAPAQFVMADGVNEWMEAMLKACHFSRESVSPARRKDGRRRSFSQARYPLKSCGNQKDGVRDSPSSGILFHQGSLLRKILPSEACRDE